MRRAALAALAAALVTAAPAAADEQIRAETRDRYANPSVTIDQGERLTFFNGDLLDDHSVTATGNRPDGRSLFDSGLIGPGREAVVEGAQFLGPGSYPYYCTLHPFMTGTVTVTGAGAPAPVPADSTPAKAVVAITTGSLPAVQRTGKLPVRARVDEAATVRLIATTRVARRTITLGSTTMTLAGAGSRTGSIALTRVAKRALRGRRTAAVSLTGQATDRAGNASATTSRRTLRR